jgi:hypothetical protein
LSLDLYHKNDPDFNGQVSHQLSLFCAGIKPCANICADVRREKAGCAARIFLPEFVRLSFRARFWRPDFKRGWTGPRVFSSG